jgi:tRNA (cytidine32/uridine32-2'-O)-methyltransferase
VYNCFEAGSNLFTVADSLRPLTVIVTDTGSDAVTNSNSGDVTRAQNDRSGGVRIVLVGTTHPGNIGSSARAMKVMGFHELSLVAPRNFPAAAATAMASGADDILVAAQVVDTVEEAVAGCAMVLGTTARDRHLQWPILSPRQAAVEAETARAEGTVALVFGREQAGLTNAELDLCQRVIRIPTDPDFNSLNLAQAVQICVYELRQHNGLGAPAHTDGGGDRDRMASAPELEMLYQHLISSMAAVGYFDPSNPRLLKRRLRRLLNGSNVRQSEAQILRGYLAAIDRKLGGTDKPPKE